MRDLKRLRSITAYFLFLTGIILWADTNTLARDIFESKEDIEAGKEAQREELQKKFEWWPTDAKPGPVKDEIKGGYWWWPTQPGKITPWGNRGWVYVYKIIFDYKSDELPPPKAQELRPSLLVKKTIKNVKILFDFDSAELRDDAVQILNEAVKTLRKNPQADILITGNCDVRGSEGYNIQLGKKRALAVKQFMLDNGIAEEDIRIISRGKMDAMAPVHDLVGMQKDRNAHFVIAEVEEVMIPYPGGDSSAGPEEASQEVAKPIEGAKPIEDGKYLLEEEKNVESTVKVSTKEYTIKTNDSLWKIAEKELGKGTRWKYLYELNKDRIKNPNKLKAGTVIIIPVE